MRLCCGPAHTCQSKGLWTQDLAQPEDVAIWIATMSDGVDVDKGAGSLYLKSIVDFEESRGL